MTPARSALRRAAGAAFLAAVLISAGAAGGEPPAPYTGAAWQDGQSAAAKSTLVVIVKVVEAGKPEGSGWGGNFNRVGNHTEWTGEVDLCQEVTVEVGDVLRGKRPAGRLRVKLGKFTMRYRALQSYWSRYIRQKNKQVVGMSIPVAPFALRKEGSYLLFLKPAAEEETGMEATGAPVAASDARVVQSVRAFSKVLAVWEHPPKLAPEEEKKARAMIGQLGHADYKKRAAADSALRAVGHLLRPYLVKAAGDQDLEKATAAERIIRDFAPQAGKTITPRLPEQVIKRMNVPKPVQPPGEKNGESPPEGAPAPSR
mgnify:CR=1 FL=1